MTKHRHDHDKRHESSAEAAAQPGGPEAALPQDVESLREAIAQRDAEIETLKQTVAELQQKVDALHRTAAELDNRRKRTERQMEDASRYALQHLAVELLPAIDNLERALEHGETAHDFDVLLAGVRLARDQLLGALKKYHIEKVEALGQPFDPAHHEAVTQLESAEHPDQTVIQVHQEGYRLHDRLIRPSRVVVSRTPARTDEQAEQPPEEPSDEQQG